MIKFEWDIIKKRLAFLLILDLLVLPLTFCLGLCTDWEIAGKTFALYSCGVAFPCAIIFE